SRITSGNPPAACRGEDVNSGGLYEPGETIMSRYVWYFAYGSNMDSTRMKDRIDGWEARVPGVLRGWKLVFNKVASKNPQEGFANIVPAEGDVVEGCLYLVSAEALDTLDVCEAAPDHYERREVAVERRDTGEVVTATAYVAQPDKVKEGLQPARRYLDHLLAGGDCLSEEYVRRLRATETLD
ncbi:MAG: gamma-glutamylcyclotransferase, partial [Pyrinomonas sp.]